MQVTKQSVIKGKGSKELINVVDHAISLWKLAVPLETKKEKLQMQVLHSNWHHTLGLHLDLGCSSIAFMLAYSNCSFWSQFRTDWNWTGQKSQKIMRALWHEPCPPKKSKTHCCSCSWCKWILRSKLLLTTVQTEQADKTWQCLWPAHNAQLWLRQQIQ